MLHRKVRPYVPLSFDENKKTPQESKINEEIIKKGYEEGFNKGQKEIKEKSDELSKTTEVFKNLIKELREFKHKQIESLLPQILKLAFQIAEKVVATKISLDKEATLSIVKEALKTIPLSEEKIIIKISPEDYDYISQKIDELEIDRASIQIEPSDEIKGGCSIETQSQHIVSTVEQRLKEIENALNSILSQ
ncbi:MAG: FliH/SctL family protein [Thermodesulfovibrio sp.]